jgi:hypothetical protein
MIAVPVQQPERLDCWRVTDWLKGEQLPDVVAGALDPVQEAFT